MIRPRLSSTIERRLLVNYRVDPHIAAALLPAPLRPQLVRGQAVAGICLLRIGGVRPAWAPAATGLTSENAAHRISVEWDGPDGVERGVYIPRRDTASRLNAFAGGRIYPGEHGRADFTVREEADRVRVAFATRDGEVEVDATVEDAGELRGSELFTDLAEASEFFRLGSRGLSPAAGGSHLDVLELSTPAWKVTAGRPRTVRSSFFEDLDRFPPGSAVLDSALVMRGVAARWTQGAPLRVGARTEVRTGTGARAA
ncbi:DUF2071 domain-containing protein [Streptomyces bacillaris]|uniref:DUF2071 domain-containing protein n=1 Tax=Streptomyces cavourensis TaxID=67258 RepID=A0AAD0VE59_9ACTN|nr:MULTISPECIES: DUF2071 domain-containing protein [Streptomyces]NUW23861.1 hypothetical protein [Streptomyces roseoviolaceus]ATY95734.1 hypothetical protein CVT27_09755 [Streptomyces cavourensis]AXI71586.1 hypothetical protein DTW94_09990 [Streptomyces cavourensis]NUV83508.1 hypothetical protein [Streptomyces sp. CAI-155]NUV89645.1 hypothetical protein [Streptomyces sp. KAI-26]